MSETMTLEEIKQEIKWVIRSNSDRGFLPYGGCNRVCLAMMTMVEGSESLADWKESFHIHLYVLTEAIKLIAHADTSSGMVTDLIKIYCLNGIEKLSKSAPPQDHRMMLDSIIKTVKKKPYQEWAEFGYRLLRNAAYLVEDRKQAEKVYGLFPLLGKRFGEDEYPDRYIVTQGIIERLDGPESAEQYRMEHIHIPEIRRIVVDQAMSSGNYALAEELCLEALRSDKSYERPKKWAYDLERIYAELGQTEKQTEIVRRILFDGNSTYYQKLKELYLSEGVWEEQKEPLLDQLSKAYMSHGYASILEKEGEWERLMQTVRSSPLLIVSYAKQLARVYPEETYRIYEEHIWSEAAEAGDRRKYKGVCKLIKGYAEAGAKEEALQMIRQLAERYPRRVALLDELEALSRKLAK